MATAVSSVSPTAVLDAAQAHFSAARSTPLVRTPKCVVVRLSEAETDLRDAFAERHGTDPLGEVADWLNELDVKAAAVARVLSGHPDPDYAYFAEGFEGWLEWLVGKPFAGHALGYFTIAIEWASDRLAVAPKSEAA